MWNFLGKISKVGLVKVSLLYIISGLRLYNCFHSLSKKMSLCFFLLFFVLLFFAFFCHFLPFPFFYFFFFFFIVFGIAFVWQIYLRWIWCWDSILIFEYIKIHHFQNGCHYSSNLMRKALVSLNMLTKLWYSSKLEFQRNTGSLQMLTWKQRRVTKY